MPKKINVSKYLKAPDECPFCHSSDIDADPIEDYVDIKAWRIVSCEDCGRKWQEEFTITNVRAYDKNGNIEEE
jgi:hypothetical protein